MANVENHIDKFLDRYCAERESIRLALTKRALKSLVVKHPGSVICEEGKTAEACWLIIDGTVEIQQAGKYIRQRGEGELVGEQAFLKSLAAGTPRRHTATMIARSNVELLCIDASFHEALTEEDRSKWFLTLAAVVNEKLEQATKARALLQSQLEDSSSILERFATHDALGLVRIAAKGDAPPIYTRDALVWFSDIAKFSRWAANKSPEVVARTARVLLGLQVDKIHEAGGFIDKLMGDGLMACWFIDTAERRTTLPASAIDSAIACTAAIDEFLANEGLTEEVNIRIGLHAGPVAFGDFGVHNRIAVSLLGETVNLAARYEQASSSELGRIRISPTVHALLSGHSLIQRFKGPVKVQAKTEEINVYTV